jgi:hypothetical protein
VRLVVSDPEQVVLGSDPYRRLAYTWHTFTPEWAAQVGMDVATAATWRAELRSRVAFDIEDIGNGVVKLTVTHEGFVPGSAVLPDISQGWPAVLSSLKTLLETGSTLRTAWRANDVSGRRSGIGLVAFPGSLTARLLPRRNVRSDMSSGCGADR